MSAAPAGTANELKGAARAAFVRKNVRQAEQLYREALVCLRNSPPHGQQQTGSEATSEQDALDEARMSSAEQRVLEATILSNIAICRKLVGEIKESLQLSKEVLVLLDQPLPVESADAASVGEAETPSDQQAAINALREKNELRVKQLGELHDALAKMEQLRDGTADAATVAAADSCSGNRANLAAVLEYYYYGHDEPVSAVKKLTVEDGVASTDGVALFFGGCGDCRHVFGTLFDLVNRVLGGSHPTKKGIQSVKLELNDIHPFAVARFAVVCAMSAEVHKLRKQHLEDNGDRTKLRAVAMAVQSFACGCFIRREHWTGIVKPILERVKAAFEQEFGGASRGQICTASNTEHNADTEKETEQNTEPETAKAPAQPVSLEDVSLSWLTCDAATATEVVEAIELWMFQEGEHDAISMRDHIAECAENQSYMAKQQMLSAPGMKERLIAAFHERRQKAIDSTARTIRQLPAAKMDLYLSRSVPESERARVLSLPLKEKHQIALDMFVEEDCPSDDPLGFMMNLMMQNVPNSTKDKDIISYLCKDSGLGKTMSSVLLDIAFWYKHNSYPPLDTKINPPLAKFFDSQRSPVEALYTFLSKFRKKQEPDLGLPDFRFEDEDILWNPTIFSEFYLQQRQEIPDLAAFAEPIAITLYDKFIVAGLFSISPEVSSVPDLAAQFYGDIGSAFALLSREHGEYRLGDRHSGFSVTLSCGDVFAALRAAVRAGDFFDQVSLSNIPDYTGLLPVFSYGITALKEHGTLLANVLLNTGMWKTYGDYLYHMGFSNLKEAKNFCQAQYVGDADIFGSAAWQKSAGNWWEEGEVLRKKADFVDWLHDVLLNILLPSHEKDQSKVVQPMKATRPQSLAAFFQLATIWRHPLPRIWHAEVVRDILKSGELKTRWQHHPVRKNPVQLNARRKSQRARKIDLSFAVAELATLAAVFQTPVACLAKKSRKAKNVPGAGKGLAPLSIEEVCRIRVQPKVSVTPMLFRGSDAGYGVAIVRAQPSTWDVGGNWLQPLYDIRKALRHRDDSAVRAHHVADPRSSDVEVLHLISTCHVDFAGSRADFLLPRDIWYNLLEDGNVAVMLFSYYNWLTVSEPLFISEEGYIAPDLELGGVEDE